MLPKTKKSLGQNFLVDKNIQRKILAASGFHPDDVVLEIGAGRGDLTAHLAQAVKIVFAVEIDTVLCSFLKERFSGIKNVNVIQADILKLNLGNYRIEKNKINIIGNIPYYITTPIIEQLIKFRAQIKTILLTVQKEFARRVVAAPGSKTYGSFSCFAQYYTQPEVLFDISKSSFFPRPKVDSSFLRLIPKKNLPLNKSKEAYLFKVIRSAFGKRRKTLRNSLSNVVSAESLSNFFAKYGIDENTRPEDLSLEEFIALAKT